MVSRAWQCHRFPFRAMGSPCEVQLYAPDRADAERIARLAIGDVARLESRYSRYRDDSLLADINRVAATGGEVTVDDETAGLMDYAETCFVQSGGLFDITAGVLRSAWPMDRCELPDSRQIQSLLARVGWQRLSWQRPRLRFPVPGLELDLGGIVKEYAADRAAALCRAAGAHHGFVNLGGDVCLVGPRLDGRPWQVAITHPRRPGEALVTLALDRGAVATSGDYERCIMVDGRRYGHVLNARTGWPVEHLASVSVVAELCVMAGSASTIAMLREQEGPRWLEGLGLPHFWVGVDGARGGPLAGSSGDQLASGAPEAVPKSFGAG